MSARSIFTLTLVAAGVLAPAAIADAKTSVYPTISKIEPMRVSIGETMTITGKSFLKGKGKNTVVFRRAGRPNIFVKADGLTTKRLTVKVPAKLASSLGKKSGKVVATRFQIRVMARRLSKTYTKLSKSPTVLPASQSAVTPLTKAADPGTTGGGPAPLTPAALAPATPVAPSVDPPADCDADGTPDATDADDDNDLLPDEREAQIGTNRCDADTDGDGMEDGWEYQSAVDLNQNACPKAPGSTDDSWDYPKFCSNAKPFPGNKPYPNPLSPDTNSDYDGDGMPAWAEHAAWRDKARRDARYDDIRGAFGMWYTAGRKASIDDAPEPNTCTGQALPNNGRPFGTLFNMHPIFEIGFGTGNFPVLESSGSVLTAYRVYILSRQDKNICLEDDERDEDNDFLSNIEELRGQMSSPAWWESNYKENQYEQAYSGTDFLNADSDGDGDRYADGTLVPDGLEDTDSDGFLNIEELNRGLPAWTQSSQAPGQLTGLWVNPFNPCLPNPGSETCQKHPQFGVYNPPFSNPENPIKTRWPLYANPLYGAGLRYPVTYSCDHDGNSTTPMIECSIPAEVWTPVGLPAGYDDTAEPPMHPLPRPDYHTS